MTPKTKKTLLALGLAAAALLLCAGYLFFFPIGSSERTTYLYIDQDDDIDSVFHKLDATTGGTPLLGMKLLTRLTAYDKRIRTGRYAISPTDGTLTLFRKLRNGTQAPVRLHIREVRTIGQLAAHLSAHLQADSATIATRLSDSAYTATLGLTPQTVISLFIPNTYEVYWDTPFDKFMKRMQREHRAFWTSARLDKAAACGLTPVQVYTLASIVDEETANNAEKPMVAGMYINRLKHGMPLQADPTVKFALQDFSLRRIYHKHLTVRSPYNTYVNTGLPPGPIRIPSVAGIDAVLDHVRHDYLYMCAKEDFSGTHNFAKTYDEHLKNAAKYTEALNARAIR